MSDVSRKAASGSSTIVDAPKVILGLFVSIILVVIAFCCFLTDPKTGELLAPTVGLVFVGLAVMGVIVFIVNAKGYVIDVENDTLTFPGGGIEAESWLSYFNPMYWLQGFKRHQIQLSAIRQAEAYRETKTHVSSQTGQVHTRKTDVLEVSGDFGAVRFSFVSKGKRDQLCSAIVQLNEMGSPMLRR